jgi:hypothetical protein
MQLDMPGTMSHICPGVFANEQDWRDNQDQSNFRSQAQAGTNRWTCISQKGVEQPYDSATSTKKQQLLCQKSAVSEIGGFRGEVVTLHHPKSHAPKWTKGLQSSQKAIASKKQIQIQNLVCEMTQEQE